MRVDEYAICQIPEINLSCYGCCGRHLKSKEAVEKDIEENTRDFSRIDIPSTVRLLDFRDRFSKDNGDVKGSGICSNLVKFRCGVVACPLHKLINKIVPADEFMAIHRKDLRWGHCDVNFECRSVKIFKKLPEDERRRFLNWIREQRFDNYKYSKLMVDGVLIKRYLKKVNIRVF